jgi:nitrite reductase (NADH) large subunit
MTAAKRKVVIVGNGMVGQRLLDTLAADAAALEISVLAEESRFAYDRVHLSDLFAGKSAKELSLVAEDFFARHGMNIHVGESAAHIDRRSKRVRTSHGRELPYDVLVIATGSYPFVPPIPGRDRAGVFVYRTIDDLEAIQEAARSARSGAVVGGGLLGLEAAKALRDLGLETHVVEFAPRLMALQLDDTGAALLRRRIEALDVTVHLGANTREIVAGEDAKHRMCFADRSTLEVDLIVFSAGIRPRDSLAREAGLAVGERGGIVIDETCRTSDPSIYAVGECALWDGRVFGLVSPGYQMARVAAAHIVGSQAEVQARFRGADMSTKLKLLGVDVASIGDAHASTPGARCCTLTDERQQTYKKLVLDETGRRLLGAILVGDAESYGTLLQATLNQLPLPERPDELLWTPREAGAEATPTHAQLPPNAQICSCNAVSAAAICSAIDNGHTSLAAIKTQTKAATSCGGCAPLVTQILKRELARRGVGVNNHLCEHFPYSRQQVFHLVRVGEIRTFETLLKKHGRGLGCDICKPTVASILASCWNDFVLAPDKAPLQDSNDYFLANIQKDGTYSIVPRVPAGEITPRQLIAIGEIAQRYGLYTKITGGQRIDMFGAQVHQLPAIWRALLSAGFESGHAYGKAVRTVKSCVGSTWCRYGVQDSVALAIRIEHRYKGIRSPHKLKFAVSGCTRECAEAQSKDVGVIATEKGWNLYVCGNGGMKPRHADLLARDVDEDKLIRYIDRFLMFYIRTADRLQRTSVWRDNLEGGLEYLKEVVCEDRLGVAAELEADMRGLIDSYECEWKRVIQDPRAVRRFRHFVNTDQPDDAVVFIEERGQRRPARPDERTAAPEAV